MSPTAARRLVLWPSFLFSQVVLFVILRFPDTGSGSWISAFRGYASYDQLSYAAIASTVASGNSATVEPFTETGYSYYPSLWYRILGWLAAVTGFSVPTVWTLAGYALLAGSVAILGHVGYRISKLAWAPALVAPALTIGTLAMTLVGDWKIPLDSHAVLWGPYGALYTLNGEVAAFALLGISLAIVLRLALGAPTQDRWRLTGLSVAAILIGVTANIHTYAFFVGTGIAFAWLGLYGLLRHYSRALLVTTLALIAATFALGPIVASRVGALPVYVLFIGCTLPGILSLAKQHWRTLGVPAIAFVLCALPQAAIVVGGVLRDDDFLNYRQVQSAALGVPVAAAIVATVPLAAVWAFSLVVQRTARNDAVVAALGGMAFAGAMLTFNDAWGFGQEPYRMWINSVTVCALMLAPLTAWSVARWREAPAGFRSPAPGLVGLAAVGLVGLSFIDFGAFRLDVEKSGVIRFDSSRDRALTKLTADAVGLLAPGPCIDAQTLKIVTRKPVAFYNPGLAWPENKGLLDSVIDSTRNGVFAPDAMRAANVQYLVTDNACAIQWPVDQAMGFAQVDSWEYSDEGTAGTITLWRIA